MIPKSLLLGMLKPLLPKLEGFLKNHPDLKDKEESRIVLRIEEGEIVIDIVAYQFENGAVISIRKLQNIDPKNL